MKNLEFIILPKTSYYDVIAFRQLLLFLLRFREPNPYIATKRAIVYHLPDPKWQQSGTILLQCMYSLCLGRVMKWVMVPLWPFCPSPLLTGMVFYQLFIGYKAPSEPAYAFQPLVQIIPHFIPRLSTQKYSAQILLSIDHMQMYIFL